MNFKQNLKKKQKKTLTFLLDKWLKKKQNKTKKKQTLNEWKSSFSFSFWKGKGKWFNIYTVHYKIKYCGSFFLKMTQKFLEKKKKKSEKKREKDF